MPKAARLAPLCLPPIISTATTAPASRAAGSNPCIRSHSIRLGSRGGERLLRRAAERPETWLGGNRILRGCAPNPENQCRTHKAGNGGGNRQHRRQSFQVGIAGRQQEAPEKADK